MKKKEKENGNENKNGGMGGYKELSTQNELRKSKGTHREREITKVEVCSNCLMKH